MKWSAIPRLINTIDMTNLIWNVRTLLLLSFQFTKKRKKSIYLLLFKTWYQLSCEKKNLHCSWIYPMIFLKNFFPTKLSQHCAAVVFAAVIPQSKHKSSLVHASYCWGVCGHESESYWSRWAHTLATQCMLQDHTSSRPTHLRPPLHVTKLPLANPVFIFHHVLVDVKWEKLISHATVKAPKTVKDTEETTGKHTAC